jgi:hypothetical protein
MADGHARSIQHGGEVAPLRLTVLPHRHHWLDRAEALRDGGLSLGHVDTYAIHSITWSAATSKPNPASKPLSQRTANVAVASKSDKPSPTKIRLCLFWPNSGQTRGVDSSLRVKGPRLDRVRTYGALLPSIEKSRPAPSAPPLPISITQ